MHDAMSESRLVALPKFQGLGVGTNISELVAAILCRSGLRFLPNTSHARLGGYRTCSALWKTILLEQMERPLNSLNGKQINNFSAEIFVLKVTKVAI